MIASRRIAWVTLVGTLMLSIAAQIGYACLSAGPAGPPTGRLVASISWPILTLMAVEIAVRIPWPTNWVWQLTRWVGVGGVGGVAAVVSYAHLSGLLRAYGEPSLVVVLGPIAADGLMLTSAAALVACDRRMREVAAADPSTTVSLPEPAADAGKAGEAGEQLTEVARERVQQVTAAIKAGEMAPQPSAVAIQNRFQGSTAIARQVRDIVADVTPDVPTTTEKTSKKPPERAALACQTI